MSDTCTALVTGASRGIGKAIGETLAASGYRVVGTATTTEGATRISEHLARYGDTHRGVVVDVSKSSSIDVLFSQLDELKAVPQVLINNAGLTRDNLLLRMKDDEWDHVVAADLSAVFHLCKRVLRAMVKARYGRIVNLTSIVGATGNAGQANYAAAKAGVIGFTKSLALEVATRGITVNAVAPGLIDTDMTRALNDTQRDATLARIPMGRFGAVEEIAAMVKFLASDQAAYVTGQTIHVNGGMYLS